MKPRYRMHLHSNRWTPGVKSDHEVHSTNAQYLLKGERFRHFGVHYECTGREKSGRGYIFYSKRISTESLADSVAFLQHGFTPNQNPEMRLWRRSEC